MVKRIYGLYSLKADSPKDGFDIDLVCYAAHHRTSSAGVGLMSGHGGGGIIQYDQGHIRLIVYGINHAWDRGREEGGISDECKADGVRFYMSDALGDPKAGAHAQTGIYHVERHSVAEGVAPDISAENGLPALHGCLDCVEGGPVRASCAEYRRTYRKSRRNI